MLNASKGDSHGKKSCFLFYLGFLVFLGKSAGHTYGIMLDLNGRNVITSPGYPENYPDNANYTWILNTGDRKANVTFSILDFDVPRPYQQPQCDDFLKIEEVDPCCFTLLKRCDRGEFKPFNITATGNNITISFVSDDKYNAKGFNLTWKVYLSETITTSTTTTLPTTLRTATPSPSPPRTTTTLTTAITKTNGTKSSPSITDTSWTIQQSTKSHYDITTGLADNTRSPEITRLNLTEIVPLILGISAIEIALIAIGVYIVKKRRSSSREKKNQDVNFDKQVQPVSRESVQSIHSIGNVYESIPLEHFSTDVIVEDDGNENQE
uniref:Cubilin-like n=1 Tax=Crassostrea virginica TaxID=6565 RepID=A0A8B8DDZ9_CRAVI|nr:cubilin-like [Crassostrea virginica]